MAEFHHFFFNFIVQNRKMLEITSNFKITLDLFELATFGKNYGLQMADKTITGCTKLALRCFCPIPAKRRLEMIDTVVFFIENLSLQNVPSAKVQWIKIRKFWFLYISATMQSFFRELGKENYFSHSSRWKESNLGIRPSAHPYYLCNIIMNIIIVVAVVQ